MKKLAFLFVAIVAVSFASCGNKSNADAEAAKADSIRIADSIAAVEAAAEAEAAAADTMAVDSVVATEEIVAE